MKFLVLLAGLVAIMLILEQLLTFDFIFETRPISLANFCLLRLTLPFGGIYVVIKLVRPERDCCWEKRRMYVIFHMVLRFAKPLRKKLKKPRKKCAMYLNQRA